MKNVRTPILITGAQRSGTTWVGRTLSQHPLVRYEHEPFNAFYPNRMFGLKLDTLYAHYESSNQQAEIARAFNKLLYAGKFAEALALCKATGISRKTPLQFFKQLFLTPRQRILVKDPVALFSADWLYKTYHFQVVCMIRNPLAFVASQKKAGWDTDFKHIQRQDALIQNHLMPFKTSIDSACKYPEKTDLIDRSILLWNVLHSVIIEYKKTYPEWLFLKHEAVAQNPIALFARIFEFVGLEQTAEIQAYISTYTSPKNAVHAETTKYQPRNSKASLYAWKEILSTKEIDRIISKTNDIAAHFYSDITAWPPEHE